MNYKYEVVEIFDSIQGEGMYTGLWSTFIRLAGCNLSCKFCDTYFDKGKVMTVEEIISKCGHNVVITGGEPLIHDLRPLTDKLSRGCHHITVETNGTVPINGSVVFDAISLSPKFPLSHCKVSRATSIKILFPYYNGATAIDYDFFPAQYKSLQVIDPDKLKNVTLAMEELKTLGSDWRLGIQIHKFIGVK